MSPADDVDGADNVIDDIVELYKARVYEALDGLSLDDIKQLVADIEARLTSNAAD